MGSDEITTDFAISDYAEVRLDSVELNLRSLRGSANVQLALTTSTGVVLSVSDNGFTEASKLQKITFSDTWVSTKDTLYFVFVAGENDRIEVGYQLKGASDGGTGDWAAEGGEDMLTCGAGSAGVADYNGMTNNMNSLYFIGTDKSQSMAINSSVRYAPVVSITTYIPEPATATLSLLALAGLAARLRR